MKPQTLINSTRGIWHVLLGLGLILVLTGSQTAFSCHNGKNHGGANGQCSDPPPDADISTIGTTAHWTLDTGEYPNTSPNTILELTGPRTCGPGAGGPLAAEHGEYACNHSGQVHFNLTNGVLDGKKGSPDMCNNFKAWTWDNSSYNYIWNGDCTAGDCWFHIFNWAFESHAITEPTTLPEPVGLLWVEAFAQLPADFPKTTEPNPYVVPLELWIDEVLVIYKALGKNRTMATCRFNPGPGEVRFFSEPNTQ